ncbi:MAG: hypothetical protein LUE21_05865, partial [Oscillospiraceae bacterium]|nr:hypothetical protein [Oscillospiraceae bacterium]
DDLIPKLVLYVGNRLEIIRDSGAVHQHIQSANSNCTFPGVGLYVAANKVYITNALIETTGTHRPALYTATDDDANGAVDQQTTVVLTNSVLMGWGSEGDGSSAPAFTGMYGSARPTLLMVTFISITPPYTAVTGVLMR